MQQFAAGFAAALQAGYPPDVVAEQVLDGIRADRFYIFPAQPEIVALVDDRMTGIIERRNPDPRVMNAPAPARTSTASPLTIVIPLSGSASAVDVRWLTLASPKPWGSETTPGRIASVTSTTARHVAVGAC